MQLHRRFGAPDVGFECIVVVSTLLGSKLAVLAGMVG